MPRAYVVPAQPQLPLCLALTLHRACICVSVRLLSALPATAAAETIVSSVKLHYQGWAKRWDEWVMLDCGRVRKPIDGCTREAAVAVIRKHKAAMAVQAEAALASQAAEADARPMPGGAKKRKLSGSSAAAASKDADDDQPPPNRLAKRSELVHGRTSDPRRPASYAAEGAATSSSTTTGGGVGGSSGGGGVTVRLRGCFPIVYSSVYAFVRTHKHVEKLDPSEDVLPRQWASQPHRSRPRAHPKPSWTDHDDAAAEQLPYRKPPMPSSLPHGARSAPPAQQHMQRGQPPPPQQHYHALHSHRSLPPNHHQDVIRREHGVPSEMQTGKLPRDERRAAEPPPPRDAYQMHSRKASSGHHREVLPPRPTEVGGIPAAAPTVLDADPDDDPDDGPDDGPDDDPEDEYGLGDGQLDADFAAETAFVAAHDLAPSSAEQAAAPAPLSRSTLDAPHEELSFASTTLPLRPQPKSKSASRAPSVVSADDEMPEDPTANAVKEGGAHVGGNAVGGNAVMGAAAAAATPVSLPSGCMIPVGTTLMAAPSAAAARPPPSRPVFPQQPPRTHPMGAFAPGGFAPGWRPGYQPPGYGYTPSGVARPLVMPMQMLPFGAQAPPGQWSCATGMMPAAQIIHPHGATMPMLPVTQRPPQLPAGMISVPMQPSAAAAPSAAIVPPPMRTNAPPTNQQLQPQPPSRQYWAGERMLSLMSDAELSAIFLSLQLTRNELKTLQEHKLPLECEPPAYLIRLNMGGGSAPQRYKGAQVGGMFADEITLCGVDPPEAARAQASSHQKRTRVQYVSNRHFEPQEILDLVHRLHNGTLNDLSEAAARARIEKKRMLLASVQNRGSTVTGRVSGAPKPVGMTAMSAVGGPTDRGVETAGEARAADGGDVAQVEMEATDAVGNFSSSGVDAFLALPADTQSQ